MTSPGISHTGKLDRRSPDSGSVIPPAWLCAMLMAVVLLAPAACGRSARPDRFPGTTGAPAPWFRSPDEVSESLWRHADAGAWDEAQAESSASVTDWLKGNRPEVNDRFLGFGACRERNDRGWICYWSYVTPIEGVELQFAHLVEVGVDQQIGYRVLEVRRSRSE